MARARKKATGATIPLTAQTFSKSYLQYPQPSPIFLSHGDGGLAWDIDGNEYVDLVSALLPNVLGARDHDVDAAVRRQLNSGISFSLATELEAQLAETLCRLIPCAEAVRSGKTGTDVTTAAIRLARVHRARPHPDLRLLSRLGGLVGRAQPRRSRGCAQTDNAHPALSTPAMTHVAHRTELVQSWQGASLGEKALPIEPIHDGSGTPN